LSQPASPPSSDEPGGRLGIGEVLARLQGEFADVTVSKIRFLEAEGLVRPARAPSGYRKFSEHDVERLRYVLAAQRDHYLPLKVIKEHLSALDRGLRPAPSGGQPAVPADLETSIDAGLPGPATFGTTPELRLTRDELLESAAVSADQLEQLEAYGLVRRSGRYYDADALTIARTAGEIASYGVEARHLRPFRTAADREVGLVEQVVAPLVRHRDGEHAEEVAAAMAALSVRLHCALVRSGLRGLGLRRS
jgi:DNA-binding transcriptional MerR regulator